MMLLITKALALAVVENHFTHDTKGDAYCIHCRVTDHEPEDSKNVSHSEDCIVHKAKLLLKKEWGIES